ncbi:hypothetical protein C463_08631 [Halorubrum californiense DSM 19288]|uniref:Uncharacterized protein n=1 Tax=Halorubrum californiense DSM 19288 TaxID=1227465 RepID=M0E9C4_9EURY|nr:MULTISPECIES: hypothetical protein [Halorubrum]ELZ44406.1 hypothetical protein C463_08631 [Halorubrum californiense DSM 19288]TKX71954.1 hypothetical protein EXE40_06415 [Halorubrum sp. GN11GM_10-3_MGM]
MVNVVRAVGAAAESLWGLGLLALARTGDGTVPAAPFATGFAVGYLYRHARATADCRRFRGGPGRSLGIALAWSALGVAAGRSMDGRAASRAFAAGLGLGSAGYWLARRGE